MPRIALIGATGLLGQSLADALPARWSVIPTSRSTQQSDGLQIDCSQRDSFVNAMNEIKPTAIINVAALANVDTCEQRPDDATRSNVDICRNIACWAQGATNNPRIVHISTDQVYSGEGPHDEDGPAPLNHYGRTKLLGEKAILAHDNAAVLRTNFFGIGPLWSGSLAQWILDSLINHRDITLFDDILFNPLYVSDLNSIIIQALESPITGVFNAGARGGMSKAAFGERLALLFRLDFSNVQIGPSSTKPRPALRPKDMRMDVRKLEHALGIQCPTIEDGLQAMKNDPCAINWSNKS